MPIMQNSASSQINVHELAHRYGIASSYTDGVGSTRHLSPETLLSILNSMGVQAESTDSIVRSLNEVCASSWQQLIDEVLVIAEGTFRPSIVVSMPVGSPVLEDVSLSWTITNENQETQSFFQSGKGLHVDEETVIGGIHYVRVLLPLQATLVLGYYWLFLTVTTTNQSIDAKTLIIVSPLRCHTPRSRSRSFGVSLQLYNLRTNQNWGIGDFRDLKAFLRWSGKNLGATTVGVSPLQDTTTGVSSPYSPSSRLFFNPLYLDIEAISEFRSTPSCQRRFHSKRFQKTLHDLRTSGLVQYERVRSVKTQMLENLYRAFKQQHVKHKTSRFRTFERYCLARGEYLKRYCLFQVLSERIGSPVWRYWPEEYRNPHSQKVVELVHARQDRLRYFQYVQWQCELQLGGINRMAKRLNLACQLYHDLPVGVHPDGADAWIFQEELASGITLGAPPDSFNLQGQNWGLMAPVPWKMRKAGYRFFIETLRRNMKYGGMLRIDHALGLFRLFIIPEGLPGDAGTYVKTPVDEVLAILALESVRYQVMVVGEDLGAITPEIRGRLTKAGLLSYRLMPFEKTQTGKFRTPKQYPEQAIVSFTTHDLPTFIGYWAGRDIETKAQASLYRTEEQIEQDWDARMKDRLAFIHALVKEGLLSKQTLTRIPLQAPYAFVKAAYAYLARTPCRILMIPLEDLLGEFEAPNLPGASTDAYPSWQLRLNRSLQAFRQDARIRSMVKVIQRSRNQAG